MPDKSDPPADTDPAVADTVSSDPGSGSGSGESGSRKRAVHAGDVLGRYELVEEVGEGGMATVFRARDRELRREVAVKVLFPHLAKRDDVVRRFHREARAAAALEHANILRVYDVGGGEATDPPYIVMELVRGRTLLAEIEQRGPMLAEVVACIGALLADALAAAHAAGVIHRDMKPSNVLIAPGGRVLLADFGVARLETEDSLVTRTGALLGTPAYMSPEQAGGDTTTARSDLYSLGATLYQLATGSLPFAGSAAKVMASIATGSLVAPVKRRAEVGPELSKLIERLMAVDPSARPQTATEVATDLRALAATSGFGEPKDEVASYFADPSDFVAKKLPAVVAATVAAGEKAIKDRRLPRAIALADRATALAPDDPAVVALVKEVTEGGRASHRKRLVLALGSGVLLVGGASAGVLALRDKASPATVADAPALIAPLDTSTTATVTATDADTVTADRPPSPSPPTDAAPAHRPPPTATAHRPPSTLDASVATELVAIDAAAPLASTSVTPDAAPVPAPPAPGAIIVRNDTWCDITIDGKPRGHTLRTPLAVDAGPHTVTCAQPGRPGWTRTVTVAPSATATVEGSLLGTVAITFGIDAAIDGTPHPHGTHLDLPAGRHELAAGKTRAFRDLRTSCTVRWVDESLECVP